MTVVIFLSQMDDVSIPGDIKMAVHKTELDNMHGGKMIMPIVLLERAISYSAFMETHGVLLLLCALAWMRKQALKTVERTKSICMLLMWRMTN